MSVALGVVLAIGPDVGALTLTTVFGLFSLVYGLVAITLSIQGRRAVRAVTPTEPRRRLTSRPGPLSSLLEDREAAHLRDDFTAPALRLRTDAAGQRSAAHSLN